MHSVFAASLPTAHSSFDPQRHLEMVPKWQAPPLPDSAVEIFIGILSAGNHFAERMAVRKSWLQHESIKSMNAVARFFVAMVNIYFPLFFYFHINPARRCLSLPCGFIGSTSERMLMWSF